MSMYRAETHRREIAPAATQNYDNRARQVARDLGCDRGSILAVGDRSGDRQYWKMSDGNTDFFVKTYQDTPGNRVLCKAEQDMGLWAHARGIAPQYKALPTPRRSIAVAHLSDAELQRADFRNPHILQQAMTQLKALHSSQDAPHLGVQVGVARKNDAEVALNGLDRLQAMVDAGQATVNFNIDDARDNCRALGKILRDECRSPSTPVHGNLFWTTVLRDRSDDSVKFIGFTAPHAGDPAWDIGRLAFGCRFSHQEIAQALDFYNSAPGDSGLRNQAVFVHSALENLHYLANFGRSGRHDQVSSLLTRCQDDAALLTGLKPIRVIEAA